MTAKDFPNSPSTNDESDIAQRDFYYDGSKWVLANVSMSEDAAFARANQAYVTAHSLIALANVPNTWANGPFNFGANIYVFANSTLNAQDTLKIQTGSGQTGNVICFLDTAGNTIWRVEPNGRQLAAPAIGFPNGAVEKPIGVWFIKTLGQDWGTASTGNNRTGFKVEGIPGKTIVIQANIIGWANTGTGLASGSAGFQFGAICSQNVYQRGFISRIPQNTSCSTASVVFSYWAPWSNAGGQTLANSVSSFAPQARVSTLLRFDGIFEFAANSVNTTGGPNVEIGFGSETGGAVMNANSSLMWMIL